MLKLNEGNPTKKYVSTILGTLFWLVVFLVIALIFSRVEIGENQAETQNFKVKDGEIERRLDELKQDNENLNNKLKEISQSKTAKANAQLASNPTTKSSGILSSPNCEQYRPLVAQYAWNVNIALAVMKAESSCNPNVVSRTNDHGLFQINNGLGIYGIQIYDPAFNVSVAYNVKYLASNWNPWTVCTKGIVNCW